MVDMNVRVYQYLIYEIQILCIFHYYIYLYVLIVQNTIAANCKKKMFDIRTSFIDGE